MNTRRKEEELRKLMVPNASDLPPFPPTAVHSSFLTYFAPDFMKPAHDHFINRPPNGLCVVGLAPGHVSLRDEGGVKGVDFDVGKSDRSAIKVTGKRKKNAKHFEANTVICKVSTGVDAYVIRCCVKGSLLEVNEKLVKQPDLLNTALFSVPGCSLVVKWGRRTKELLVRYCRQTEGYLNNHAEARRLAQGQGHILEPGRLQQSKSEIC